jgi:hypothetical protein
LGVNVVASTLQARTDTLFCALELSKNTWLRGIQFPDREQPRALWRYLELGLVPQGAMMPRMR